MSDAKQSPPSFEQIQTLATTGTFEDSLAALEAVVAHLEQGHLPLSEALAWYEAGLLLSRRCADLLQQAELRISKLESTYDFEQNSGADGTNDAR